MPLLSMLILLLNNLVIMHSSYSEQRYAEQLDNDKNFEFTWKPVSICKVRHEDNPTTKEDF